MSTEPVEPSPAIGMRTDFTSYLMTPTPGHGNGVQLRDADGSTIAVVEEVNDGWAIELHPSGDRLGTAGRGETLGQACIRVKAAYDARTMLAAPGSAGVR
jgi:hypothetical protein